MPWDGLVMVQLRNLVGEQSRLILYFRRSSSYSVSINVWLEAGTRKSSMVVLTMMYPFEVILV